MKAVVVHEFGPPSVLGVEEVADPIVGQGEVLVEVAAVNVVFIDTKVRAGTAAWWRPDLPYVPGNGGVSGVVREVGPGVDRALLGRRVVVSTLGGGYAELVVAAATGCVPIPDGLDTLVAAALVSDGRTAVRLSRAARPAIGEWVLVESAGGGLGSLLVQLARNAGARVVGAASTEAKRALAAELGATVTVDYTEPRWADRIREITDGEGLDVVFDGVGGDIGATAFDLVRDGGRFAVHGSSSGSPNAPDQRAVEERHVEVLGASSGANTPDGQLVRLALDEARRGRLEPSVRQVLPLEEAARAHTSIEDRSAVGKILLTPTRIALRA